MVNSIKSIKSELFDGWGFWEGIYAWVLILLQIMFYIWFPDSLFGFIAGTSGTICVILVAKRKISNYFFGFIQTGLTLVLGAQAGLIGETGENIFYFGSQILGIKEWKKNLVEDDEESKVVKTRKFGVKEWLMYLAITIALTLAFGFGFQFFNGTQPFIDAFTLVMAFVGQFLMVYRYREQWLFWGLLNIVSIYQWITLGNMSLVAMYIAFLINTIYGYIKWSKETSKEAVLN